MISIATNLITPALLESLVGRHKVCVVSDQQVANLYLKPLLAQLPNNPSSITIPAGDEQKNFSNYQKIIDTLSQQQFHRDDILIALGGGMITDLAGFAAATYMRGMQLISLPTSLLAQVDASVGGKVAINTAAGKNLVGTFYDANEVLINLDYLTTLPKREFNAGLAEIIKIALIADREFFVWLEDNLNKLIALDSQALKYTIEHSVALKQKIVAQDRLDHGTRQLLNLGHTLAHAIEQQQNYQGLLHGEAVAVGLCHAAKLSVEHGLIDDTLKQRIIELVNCAQLPTEIPTELNLEQLQQSMRLDKKTRNQQLRVILLNQQGAQITALT